MDAVSYKTLSVGVGMVEKRWLIVDAEGHSLGRIASEVAKRLRGKHKPSFTPHVDCGDNVVIINASKVQLTGSKWQQKQYSRYTGYPGGQRVLSAQELFQKDPCRLLFGAVKGMLPKNKLGRSILGNLRIYRDSEHQQKAQEPVELELKKNRKK